MTTTGEIGATLEAVLALEAVLVAGDRAAQTTALPAARQALVEATERCEAGDAGAFETCARGAVLVPRVAGADAADASLAVRALRAARSVTSREDTPYDWATCNANLGHALLALPAAERAAGLDDAIAAFRAAMDVYTADELPGPYGAACSALGNALASRPGGDRTAALAEAVDAWRLALDGFSAESFPRERARVCKNLGVTLLGLGRTARTEDERRALLREALDRLIDAAEYFTQTEHPEEWARLRLNSGNALALLARTAGPGTAGDSERKKAVVAYRHALTVFTRESAPMEWARARGGLGAALSRLPTREGQTNPHLHEAVAALREARGIFTPERARDEWTRLSNRLGATLVRLGAIEDAAHLTEAAAVFRELLAVHDRASAPVAWARTQNDLGAALAFAPAEDRSAALRESIASFERALEVFRAQGLTREAAAAEKNIAHARSQLTG